MRYGLRAIGVIALVTAGAVVSAGPVSAEEPARPAEGGNAPSPAPVVSPEREAAEAEIKALRQTIQAAINGNDMAAAESAARRALARAEELFAPDDGWIGISHETLGQILLRLRRPEDAASHLLSALEITSQYLPPSHDRYKRNVGDLVEALLAARMRDDARRLYDRVISGLDGKPDEVPALAWYRDAYGAILRRIGDNKAAEQQFRQALALRRQALPPGHFDTVLTMNQLAGILRITGRLAEAETTYLEALDIARRSRGPNDPNVGIMLDNLGTIYGEQGRLADAERVQREAVRIFETSLGADHATTGVGLGNLGTLFQRQGRKAEARQVFERSLAIYRRRMPRNDVRVATTLDNLAGLLRDVGEQPAALAMRREALQIFLANYPENHPQVATAVNNLAVSETDAGNIAEAERLYRRAIAIQAAVFGPRHHSTGIAHSNLSEILMRQGRLEDASRSLVTAIELISEGLGPDHRMLITPLRSLSGIALGLGRHRDALNYSRRAVRAELASRDREVANAADTRAVRSADEGPLFGSLSIAWRATEAKAEPAEALLAEAFETAQWITLSSAGRSLAALGPRLAATDPALGQIVRRRQDLGEARASAEDELVRLIAQPLERRDAAREAAVRARLAAHEAETANIDARLAREFPAFVSLSRPAPLTLEATQRLLQSDEALVQILGSAEFTFVFVVGKTSAQWRRIAIPRQEVERRIEALRCGLDVALWTGEAALTCLDRVGRTPERGLLPFDGAAAHALWRDLLAPFSELLADKRLLVSVAGPMSRIPLHVLLTEPSDTTTLEGMAAAPWLARRHGVVVLPAIASLETLRLRARPSAARRNYLGVANPILLGADGVDTSASTRLACQPRSAPREVVATASGRVSPAASLVRAGSVDVSQVRNLAPLPETTDEVCAVSRRLGGEERRDLLIGADASERVVKARSGSGELADYAVVHFATHGLVSGEIASLAEPALVLTPPAAATAEDDGLLTASEIATLKLDADAVLLSACNTAAGGGSGDGGEALSGLAKAFFYAGSRSLMVSHWPVESAAAVRLVTDGFTRLADAPQIGRAEALRRSMLALLGDTNDPTRAHPQVWAPFVVVGSDEASSLALPKTSEAGPQTLPVGSLQSATQPANGSRLKRSGASAPRGGTKAAPPAFDPQAVFREVH